MMVGCASALTQNWEFRRAYKKGASFAHPAFICYYVKNRKPCIRIGIVAAKKIGCAVVRNRARRVIREGFRPLCERLPKGYDYVFVAREKTAGYKSTAISFEMARLFKRAGLLK